MARLKTWLWAFWLVVLLCLGLGTTGCLSQPNIVYRFAPDTTEAERASARRAMAEVNRHVYAEDRVYEEYDAGGDDDAEVWDIQFQDEVALKGVQKAGLACREGHHSSYPHDCPGDRMLLIRRGMSDTYTEIVLTHEMLHSLGLNHVLGDASHHSIMSAETYEDSKWSLDDQAECAAHGRCEGGGVFISPAR